MHSCHGLHPASISASRIHGLARRSEQGLAPRHQHGLHAREIGPLTHLTRKPPPGSVATSVPALSAGKLWTRATSALSLQGRAQYTSLLCRGGNCWEPSGCIPERFWLSQLAKRAVRAAAPSGCLGLELLPDGRCRQKTSSVSSTYDTCV